MLPPASLVPPAPAPRPVYSFSPGIDLYALANYLFLFCASGYLVVDASRVAFPRDTIQSFRGSNATNAWFFFFASLYVMDCTLYFLVYNKWEREAIIAASRARRARGEPRMPGDAIEEDDSDFEEEERLHEAREQQQQQQQAEDEEKQSPGTAPAASGNGSEGLKHRAGHHGASSRRPSTTPDFTESLSRNARRVARKARWCFFSHEGGLINVLEVVASLIFLMDAAMTFFAGIAQVERPIQRRWDAATMTGDAVASAIFLADSMVFYHIYVRTLQPPKVIVPGAVGGSAAHSRTPSAEVAFQAAAVSGWQPRDPWFWTAVLNVGGSLVYFIASVWGIVRQNVHANQDVVKPGTYDANMLWLTQKLHAIYLGGDVL